LIKQSFSNLKLVITKQNIDETDNQKFIIKSKPAYCMDFKNLKKKIREPIVSSLFVISNQKSIG
jgi:hypothetical protein